jgi:hypothetical protein
VTEAADSAYLYGTYAIFYKVSYTNYPTVSVDQTEPFTITVEDPCGDGSFNTLTASSLTD